MSPATGANYDERAATAIVTLIPKKGRGAPRNLGDRLLSVTYTDSGTRRSTGIDVTLDNGDEELLYDEDLHKGAVLGLRYGYPGLMVDAGLFTMKEPRGSGRAGTYTINAGERKRGKMARKKWSRVWDNTTRSNAVREVLSNHFPSNKIHVDDTQQILESITQTEEHDWQFCFRQAQLAQFEFYVDENGAHWEAPRRSERPTHLLRYVKGNIAAGQIKDYSFEGLGSGIPGRVKLSGIDALTGKAFEVSVDKKTADNYVELTETSGADSPDEGDQQEQGDIGYEIVRNTGARSEAEARELANHIFKENRYGAMKLTLQLVGDPTLRSRRVILLSGLGTAFDGLWWLKSVNHTIGSGYTQEANLTREGLAKRLKLRGRKKQQQDMSLAEQLKYTARRVGGAEHQYYNASQYGVN